MFIKACFECEFHKTKGEDERQISYCQKENCLSRYSKCIIHKALDRFLNDEFIKPADDYQFNPQIHLDKK